MSQCQSIFASIFALMFFNPLATTADPKPIVDVRFDGPYRQISSSVGDEWAPTWGRDDVLYTGNDDGTSFGGIVSNNIAFGKVEGADPEHMKGATVNGMADFREPLVFGPENAAWNTIETLPIDGTRYRVLRCDAAGAGSCVATSADGACRCS